MMMLLSKDGGEGYAVEFVVRHENRCDYNVIPKKIVPICC